MKPLDNAAILLLDNHLLIAQKERGLLTQRTDKESDSLEERAKLYLKNRFAKPGAVFLHALHRLDREVSGIVILCRTSKALSRLQGSLRNGLIKKTYIALVEGVFETKQATIEHYLYHGEHRAEVVLKDHKEAKRALLTYRVLEESPSGCSLLEIELHTGRYHQIRAQLSALNHPIVGDKKYGAKLSASFLKGPLREGIALHHAEVVFPHPIGGALVKIESPIIGF